jgi:hypothetical protein
MRLISWLLAYLSVDLLFMLAMFLTGYMQKRDSLGKLKWYVIVLYVELVVVFAYAVFVAQLLIYHLWL